MYQIVFPNGAKLSVPDSEAARAMADPETAAAMASVQKELAKARGPGGAIDCSTLLPIVLQILGPLLAKCLTPTPTPTNGDVCP